MSLFGYDFNKYIVSAIKDLKFKDFSPIQKLVFDNLKSSKNIIAKSKTGSGKTHAYLLPVFNELDPLDETCQAVIVTPTIELARQVYKVALHIASFSGETINVKAYFGGTDLQKEVTKIKAHMPQVVIATPGKLEDLVIKQNVLKIHEAKYFIIDEADMVADSFLDELLNLANSLANAKKMVFSATFREDILVILKKYMTNTQILEIKEEGNENNLDIKHYLIPTKTRDRKDLLLELTSIINPYLAIIFANKSTEVDEIYQLLKEKNYNVCYLHGNLDVRSRKRIINEINDLKYQYVVATDILARGIDIFGVSHVINFNLPKDFEFYIHRSGRTGRMDMDGVCYSFYDMDNDEYLNNLEARGITFEYLTLKGGELVPYRDRNMREKRVKPMTENQIRAFKMLNQGKKDVKPGYKKKHQKEVSDLAKKIKRRTHR